MFPEVPLFLPRLQNVYELPFFFQLRCIGINQITQGLQLTSLSRLRTLPGLRALPGLRTLRQGIFVNCKEKVT